MAEKPILNAREARFLAALLESATSKEAAKKAGITEQQARHMLDDDRFMQEYIQQCRELIEQTQEILAGRPATLATLEQIANDETVPTLVRRRTLVALQSRRSETAKLEQIANDETVSPAVRRQASLLLHRRRSLDYDLRDFYLDT